MQPVENEIYGLIGCERLVRLFVFSCMFALAACGGSLAFMVFGQTKVISHGSYGVFLIGQPKTEVESILMSQNAWPPRPALYENKYIHSPSLEQLSDKFANEEGLLFWLGYGSGVPLQVEFEGDFVSNTWPRRAHNAHVFRDEDQQRLKEEYNRFETLIQIGMTRAHVVLILSGGDTPYTKRVGDFIKGHQEFRLRDWRSVREDPEYFEFLRHLDAWSFDGMRDLVWFSSVARPFSSRVTLHFRNERLDKISHQYALTEWP